MSDRQKGTHLKGPLFVNENGDSTIDVFDGTGRHDITGSLYVNGVLISPGSGSADNLAITVSNDGTGEYDTGDYANDDEAIQAAIDDAAAAGGGYIVIYPGTYEITTRISITSSNIHIQSLVPNTTILKAISSLYVGGNDHWYGLIDVRASSNVVENLSFRGLYINCNLQNKTQAISLTSGSYASNFYMKNVLIENCKMENMGSGVGDTARAELQINSGRAQFFDLAPITDVTVKDNDFGYSEYFNIYILGNDVERLFVFNNELHDTESHNISFVQYGNEVASPNSKRRSHRDWKFYHNHYYDSHNRVSGSTEAAINDQNRSGVFGIEIIGNHFDGWTGVNSDEKMINIHGSWDVTIKDNRFENSHQCISFGQSWSGANYSVIDPCNQVRVENNLFYRNLRVQDSDTNINAMWKDNIFYEVDYAFAHYSRHFPSTILNNIFVNTPKNPLSATDHEESCLFFNPEGWTVRNNTFIENRALADPTVVPTLSEESGSNSLGIRTYYVVYSFVNCDDEETLVSGEANTTIADNKVLGVTIPFIGNNKIPIGTYKVNIYVGTASGNETLQGYIPVAWNIEQDDVRFEANNWKWLEPNTGLVAGSAMPVSNTCTAKIKYGITELKGFGDRLLMPNEYDGNKFYGMSTGAMLMDVDTRRILGKNYYIETLPQQTTTASDTKEIGNTVIDQGNVTGATSFDFYQGNKIQGTLTGDITATIEDGQYIGQVVKLILVQDGVGGHGVTWPANFKKAGGTLLISQGASEVTKILMEWDGTNWNEITRALNLS